MPDTTSHRVEIQNDGSQNHAGNSSNIKVYVNGVSVQIAPGSTVLAAIALAGLSFARRSVSGDERFALCGMGICFECRVMVNGQRHVRSCQTICRPGVEVLTDTRYSGPIGG